jgi:hypothetical protein
MAGGDRSRRTVIRRRWMSDGPAKAPAVVLVPGVPVVQSPEISVADPKLGKARDRRDCVARWREKHIAIILPRVGRFAPSQFARPLVIRASLAVEAPRSKSGAI